MDTQYLLSIISSGVKNWNEWRENNPNIKPDLQGAYLPKTYLIGANFKGCDLTNTNLERSDLKGANFSEANLTRADLSEADLSEADFTGADLSEAKIRGVDLTTANLIGTKFEKTILSSTIMEGVVLLRGNLRGARLISSDLRGADLRGADLRGANLRWSNLAWSNLAWANLSFAHLIDVDFTGANLTGANLTDADLKLDRFDGINFTAAKLIGTGLEDVDLTWEHIDEPNDIEVDIALPQEEIDNRNLIRLKMALEDLMKALKYELKAESEPIQSSWWQRLIFGAKDGKSGSVVQDLRDVMRAEISGGAVSRDATDLAEAASKVIKSLADFDNAAVRIGQLLVVKITRDGKQMLRVETLSSALARRIADDPQFLLRPEEVWKTLDKSDAMELQSEQPQLSSLRDAPTPLGWFSLDKWVFWRKKSTGSKS